MESVALVASIAAGIGSLVCFILVMVHLFQQEETGYAIACIVLLFICGVGGLLAYIKGWMEGLTPVMIAWTVCILIGLVARFAAIAG